MSWGGTNIALGVFHSTQNFGNFSWRSNGTDHYFMFGPTRIIATTFEDGPLWPVWSFHCPFPFDKIVVSSTALLHPMPTFSGLGQISSADCIIPFREWNFQNFNPEFLLNRKHSLIIRRSCAQAAPGGHWCLHVTLAPRGPDNHMQGILDFMGSEHWAPFNFSYSKASYEN